MLYMRYGSMQKKVMQRTDERLETLGELLNSVRVVKYFGWESAMMARVDEKRDTEQKMIWKRILFFDADTNFRCYAFDLYFIR